MTKSVNRIYPVPVIGMVMGDSIERFLRPASTERMTMNAAESESLDTELDSDLSVSMETMRKHRSAPLTSRQERTKQWVYNTFASTSADHRASATTNGDQYTWHKPVEPNEENHIVCGRLFHNNHTHSGQLDQTSSNNNNSESEPYTSAIAPTGHGSMPGRSVLYRDSKGMVTIFRSRASATLTKSEAESSLGESDMTPINTGAQDSYPFMAQTTAESMNSVCEPNGSHQVTGNALKGKDVLKKHILLRNPQAKPMETKATKEKLDPEDELKRAKRRERNREAAQRCRLRKTHKGEALFKTFQELECSNTDLRYQIRQLEKEREKLSGILAAHERTTTCRKPSN